MKAWDFFKRFISQGAMIYTALTVFVLLISLMMSDSTAAKILNAPDFLYIALFAYALSLGSTLFISGWFSALVSRLIHAVCYNLGFFAFLMLRGADFTFSVIFTAIFAIAYTVAAVIATLVSRKMRSAKKTAPQKGNKTHTEKATAAKAEAYRNRFS